MDGVARHSLYSRPAAHPPTSAPGRSTDELARRPATLAETGLSQGFAADLLSKHLLAGGVLTIRDLSERVALAGSIIESLLGFLRQEGRTEVRGGGAAIRYALTERGRNLALDALARGGYVGPAPVPLADYQKIARAQTIHDVVTSRAAMQSAFADTVLRDSLRDQLGAAMNSGRAIFIYGPAGSGKTFITKRLARLLGEQALIPYAISVGEAVVQLYDPVVHRPAHGDDPRGCAPRQQLLLEHGQDPRYALCARPLVVSGGELTLDMLEVDYDRATRTYKAPLQLKANNGMLLIDDLGRQRVAPVDLLNRWIVPMEERRDFLHIGSGVHFDIPFDMVLVFSTNLDPLELADEAFLRRIGYKIRFDYLTPAEYAAIWQQSCAARGVAYDPGAVEFLVHELHTKQNVPLLACHPRDLLGIALDRAAYFGEPGQLTPERLQWAWNNYFVSPGADPACGTSTTDEAGV